MKAVFLRPLAVFTTSFFVLSCILFTADTAVRLWSAVIFLLLFTVSCVLRFAIPVFREQSMKSVAAECICWLLAAASLSSIFCCYNFDVLSNKHIALENKCVEFEGTVTEITADNGHYARYIVKIDNAGGVSDFLSVMSGVSGVPQYSEIRGKATFYPLKEGGEFNERRYYNSLGVVIMAEIEEFEITGEAGVSFASVINGISGELSAVYYDLLGEDAGGFAAALMLGNKLNLDRSVVRDFRRLGLSHVLAISGMHLTVICAFVAAILSPFGKKAGRVGSVATVLFYMFITGFLPSVTRSGIMLIALILSQTLKRSGDSFTNLGIAVFIISVIDPYSCADIGLQLSFCAVFAILLYMTKRRDLKNKDKKKKNILLSLMLSFLEGCLVTIIVVLFMLPLEWFYFGEISIVSMITSPLFSLGATILLWTLPLLLILSPISLAASLFAYPVKLFIELMCALAAKLSLIRGVTVSLNYPFAKVFSLLIFISVIAFCVSKKKKRIIFGAVGILLVILFGVSCFIYKIPDGERVKVVMLEDKSSDSVLIYSDYKAMIIDVGNGYYSAIGDAVNELSSVQSTEIEALMLTHLHNSHASTLNSLLASQTVRTVVLPKEDSNAYYGVINACEKHGISYIEYSPGDAVVFGECRIKTNEYRYIKRSVQPIIRLDISAYGEEFTYLGGAYCESFSDESLSECDHILFGSHGPLYKKTFSPKVSDKCRIYTTKISKKYISKKFEVAEGNYAYLD